MDGKTFYGLRNYPTTQEHMTPEEVEREWLDLFERGCESPADCIAAINDFKSALRKEIDREIMLLQAQTRNEAIGRRKAFKEVLELLDKVTPPKQ